MYRDRFEPGDDIFDQDARRPRALPIFDLRSSILDIRLRDLKEKS